MGAAWVLKTDFCSFLTNDMDYQMMKGVVNDAKLSIKVDEKEAPKLLNDLYKHLATVFSFQEMGVNKWERKRDQFLQVVRNLKYEVVEDTVEENDVDTEYKKLLIAKMKAEAEARQKAVIRGNIVSGYKGDTSTLKIFNAGAATARNVRVEWLNEDENVILASDFSVIGDLTPSMRDSAVGRGLRLTQDNEGYYGYNEGIGAYVEVISYNKLLKNARQRNQVFFDKLFDAKVEELVHPELAGQ